MITLDFSSGKITPDVTGAIPGLAVGRQKAGVHLTKGYISPDTTPATKLDESPVKLKGEVDLFVDNRAEVDQVLNGSWFFGFIQVARAKTLSASWEGRRDGEGSVELLIIGFPVSGDIILLDSDPVNQPFFSRDLHTGFSRRPQPGQRTLVHINADMGDHPNYRDFQVTTNSLTKSKNFLHTLSMIVDFTTVFVARDGSGPIQTIAHIGWNLDLTGEVRWRGGVAKAIGLPLPVKFGASTVGPPADPIVRTVLDTPGPPLVKGLVIERYQQAVLNPRMRQESTKRSLLLKRDFYI